MPTRSTTARWAEPITTTAEPTSPIKHVIVIMGENRTFDHRVRDLPAAQRRARRQSAVQGNHQQGRLARSELRQGGAVLGDGQQSLLDQPRRQDPLQQLDQQAADAGNVLRAADLLHRPSNAAALNGPGCMATLAAGRPRRLRPAPAGPAAADDRRDRHAGEFAGYAHPELQQPAERPLSAGDAAAGRDTSSLYAHLRRQPGASLLSDVAAARLRRRQGHQAQSERMPGRPVPLGRGRPSPPAATAIRRRSAARSRKAISRWASTTSPRATRPI